MERPSYEELVAALDMARGVIEDLLCEVTSIPKGVPKRLNEIAALVTRADALPLPTKSAN